MAVENRRHIFAGSGGAFSDVGKMLTHLEGAEADPRHPGNRKGSRC
jgi:hypothetical protein